MSKQPTMFDWHTAYFKNEDPSLRPTYATMAVLAAYADFRDRTCYPSQRTLARKLGYRNPDSIRRHIKANIEAGWLRKIREGSSYTTTTKYEFLIPNSPISVGEPCQDVANSPISVGDPHQDGGHSPIQMGVTPPPEWGLTTKGTTQGTTQQGGSKGEPVDPKGSSGGIGEVNQTTTQETPPFKWGSSSLAEEGTPRAPWDEVPHFDAAALPPAAKLKPKDHQPLPAGADPFAPATV